MAPVLDQTVHEIIRVVSFPLNWRKGLLLYSSYVGKYEIKCDQFYCSTVHLIIHQLTSIIRTPPTLKARPRHSHLVKRMATYKLRQQ